MNQFNPSGNFYRLETGIIARGGSSYKDFVFELPLINTTDDIANASYIMGFNVLCDTRL
jgi:hypothetical protein